MCIEKCPRTDLYQLFSPLTPPPPHTHLSKASNPCY